MHCHSVEGQKRNSRVWYLILVDPSDEALDYEEHCTLDLWTFRLMLAGPLANVLKHHSYLISAHRFSLSSCNSARLAKTTPMPMLPVHQIRVPRFSATIVRVTVLAGLGPALTHRRSSEPLRRVHYW